MKFLIVSQYFWPEGFRINDLAIELKKRGHIVTVITGKPNYPEGKFYKGYGFLKNASETFENIKIYRVPLLPRGNGSGFRLFLNYISFAFFASLFILVHRKKYDVTLTFAISPIIQIYPALLHKWLYGSKSLLWLQDLWPESVKAAGNVNSKFILSILDRMVNHIYNHTDKILVQSKAFISTILDRGIALEKIDYLPNWAEDLFSNRGLVNKLKYKNDLPNGFLIMFAGNIGDAQDFETILKAANSLKHLDDIKWIILGDGRKKQHIEQEVNRLKMSESFLFYGRFPLPEMPNFFYHADLLLISLKDEDVYKMVIPSKLQSYMAFGKPVIGMLNGAGADVINEASCGFVVPSGDYAALAKKIEVSYELEKVALLKMGENGKSYYEKHFSKKMVIDNLITICEKQLN